MVEIIGVVENGLQLSGSSGAAVGRLWTRRKIDIHNRRVNRLQIGIVRMLDVWPLKLNVELIFVTWLRYSSPGSTGDGVDRRDTPGGIHNGPRQPNGTGPTLNCRAQWQLVEKGLNF